MAARVGWNVAAVGAVLLAQAAVAQEPELTLAGNAALQSWLAGDGSSRTVFPQATCAFQGGLCGAVRRDLTVAVPPRYDWVGRFSDGRAAVRLGGLYGFVDEDGREIVEPKYRVVDDFRHGFAQVDVDGKSGLIDRDGRMVIAPKYGSITAIASDRFRVSDQRWLGGRNGSETFSGPRWGFAPGWKTTELMQSRPMALPGSSGVIDISGQWVEPGLIEVSPANGSSRASSTRTTRRCAGPGGTTCGGCSARMGAGSWSRNSSRQIGCLAS